MTYQPKDWHEGSKAYYKICHCTHHLTRHKRIKTGFEFCDMCACTKFVPIGLAHWFSNAMKKVRSEGRKARDRS